MQNIFEITNYDKIFHLHKFNINLIVISINYNSLLRYSFEQKKYK